MAMPVVSASLGIWALWYAEHDIPVFPLHTPREGGCSCHKSPCDSIGKHPRTQHGVDDATTDPTTITRWWRQWPDANIGLQMGITCFVLDVDPRKGGDTELHRLTQQYGELPETPTSHTGGGGTHPFFALPPHSPIRNRVDIAPGLDIRGVGGYVVAPPSLHASGQKYTWDSIQDFEDTPLAQAPDWLLALYTATVFTPPTTPDAPIPDGKRNDTLSRMAFAMRKAGMSLKEIHTAIEDVNQARCMPPLDAEEILLLVEGKRDIGPDPVLRPSSSKAPTTTNELPPPETLTELIAADIPPPRQLFHNFLHEGLLLFGGKSKRGKSWLIFDIAIALATGTSALQQYVCHGPTPILYLALEDGRARLQARAKAIQPTLVTADIFHLRYNFPALEHGGVEALAAEIERHKYGLVIIDVLAKLESPKQGKSDKNYHDIYDMFTPLQELRKQHPFCLAMLTHLRKQEAEDVFDSLLGSVAYQGAQDVLWVLERKPKDDYAFLHIRDKDAEDQTIALRFTNGHWEYMGDGEEFEATRDQRIIMKVLAEEGREMTIQQILKAASFPEGKYGSLRKLLVLMVKEDLIHRTRHGNYSATVHGAKHYDDDHGIIV